MVWKQEKIGVSVLIDHFKRKISKKISTKLAFQIFEPWKYGWNLFEDSTNVPQNPLYPGDLNV